MDKALVASSLQAFHENAINGLIYSFSTNWCLILLVIAAVMSVILGVVDESASVVREEQNIL